MVRAPCCETISGLKKGPWTPEEDQKLIDYIQKNGYGNWRTLPKNAGLQRCGKSCRLRWTNYLRPDIKRGRFSFEEEEIIIQLHSILGNKWSAIAARLPGRTDNEIKNYWNTHIRKRLLRMGIDPVTHSPRLDLMDLSSLLTANMYRNNQMGMQSSSVDPELIRIATSLESRAHTNDVGEYYGRTQTQFDPDETTRMIQAQSQNYNQHQQDHQNHLHQSLIQPHALQQQLADFTSVSAQAYIPIADSDPGPNPFTGLYGYGSEQSITALDTVTEQINQAIFGHEMTQSSMKSTPSSSPMHFYRSNSNVCINSRCTTSTEDDRERARESASVEAADYPSSLMKMMMKFEIPEILDASEFIY